MIEKELVNKIAEVLLLNPERPLSLRAMEKDKQIVIQKK